MKKHTITSALIVFGFLIGLATISGASVTNLTTYQNPVAGPTEDSKEAVPITIGSIDQVKDAALTLQSTFEARGNAWFRGNTYIKGFVAGANPSVLNSVIKFGGSGNSVSVDATGNTTIDEDFQTASLAAGGRVCADINGTLQICPLNPTALCLDGSIPPNGDLSQCPPAPCVANLIFHGNFRWGWVEYVGANQNHPSLTITVTLDGRGNGTSIPGDDTRDTIFTMPSGQNISYFNGRACVPGPGAGSGCEMESTGGFDTGYTSAVSPAMMQGGAICVERP